MKKEMTWRLWLKWKLGSRFKKLEINFEWLKQKFGLELTSNERGIVARWITRNVKTSIEETLDWEHVAKNKNQSCKADCSCCDYDGPCPDRHIEES